MDTISGLNAIKSVFATLGAKTSDSNYAVPLVDKTSAEPKGFMEMANLASVLGDTYSSLPSNFNDAINVGKYKGSTSNKENCPSAAGQYFVLFVIPYSNYIIQIGMNIPGGNSGNIYTRQRLSSGSWTAWQQVYDTSLLTNQALLSPLASALGVVRYDDVKWDSSVTDCNNVASGIYRIPTETTNAPSDFTSGNAFLIVFGGTSMGCQILIGNSQRNVWFRTKNKTADAWTSWMSVTLA